MPIFPQAETLRIAMENMGLTRDRFATKLGITRRALDSWLLPEGSKGHRKTPSTVLNFVWDEYLLFLRAFPVSRKAKTARAVILDSPAPVSCEIGDLSVTFPTLFREVREYHGLSYKEDKNEQGEVIGERVELVPAPIRLPTHYVLSSDGVRDSERVIDFNPISCLSREDDSGWVVIRHHRTIWAANGYLDGVLDQSGSWDVYCRLAYCDGHYFTVLNRPRRPGLPDRLVIYEAELLVSRHISLMDKEVNEVEYWTKVIGPDGQELSTDVLIED